MEHPATPLPSALADHQLISLKQLAAVANLSEVHTRRLVKSGSAPTPIRLNARKLGFRVIDVRSWLAQKAGA